MGQKPVLILGARSDIGLAIAHNFAARGHPIQLALRNAAEHEAIRSDIEIRYDVVVTLHEFDALQTATQKPYQQLTGIARCGCLCCWHA